MSDTQVTPVEEVQSEVLETPTPEVTNESPKGDRRDGGARKGGPRRDGSRGGIREEAKEFKEEMLEIARVTRVTAGGRQLRFRASIVIGDGKGRVGLGIGKSGEVQ